jgi:hypothetical protein
MLPKPKNGELGDLPSVVSSQEPLIFDAVHSKSASYGLHQRAAKTLTNMVKESYASIGTF